MYPSAIVTQIRIDQDICNVFLCAFLAFLEDIVRGRNYDGHRNMLWLHAVLPYPGAVVP